MAELNEFPEIMGHAQEDLAGNIHGQFSPEDWALILARAAAQLKAAGRQDHAAWVEVIRDFHRENYWGFSPDYKKPKIKRDDENLGVRLIWYTFRSLTLTKIAVVWFGALYTQSDEPIYKWLFIGAIALSLTNYGIFLWRYGGRSEN